ncbi:hypothetical protein LSAT2_018542 [Lamellibrachia satsuma]|nr:hypothetical protein LSAT2_018542 [Lamellibrachia satsuma]
MLFLGCLRRVRYPLVDGLRTERGSQSDAMGNIVWSIVWLLVLLFIGWPIGFFCSFFYLLLSPFAVCIDACTDVVNLLERAVKLPQTCAKNMMSGKSLC